MEEIGENWPLDSDLDMDQNNNLCFDGEDLPCDYDDESNCFDDEITDRNRRELEERLLALSATIPGLKNQMDDTLILDKASNYVKQLQQRVRELEQQQQQQQEKEVVESGTTTTNNSNNCSNKLLLIGSTSSCEEEVVSSHHDDDDNYHYYGHNNKNKSSCILPEVKAKVMQKQVLVIVHCEKQKGIMIKILSQLQNLHLSVLNSSVLPFGKSTLDITIVAQMGAGYNMTVDELVKSVRLAILTH